LEWLQSLFLMVIIETHWFRCIPLFMVMLMTHRFLGTCYIQ